MLLVLPNAQFLRKLIGLRKQLTYIWDQSLQSFQLLKKMLQKVIDFFLEKHGFRECIGAIDGTHIPIKRPSDNSCAYINRKGR